MRKLTPLILSVSSLSLFLLSSLVNMAWAIDYDMTEIPQKVANYFGISLFAGQLLVSGVMLLFSTSIVAFAMQKRATMAVILSIIIVDFVFMGFLVAMGWLDYWIFLIVCLLVGLLMAGTLRDLITGK